eukprot:Blabericola_migrator_1__686@NODE_116_length_13817_cov_119_091491_g104_i0_p6_GENE_NODE_116_length_13817_cov_119_091491_g104_i0NODE_116_length_13817_cov_119_091491_g104_i0_p6_ORF_typecomplete_len266_score52_03ATG16/PF08614_11/0_0036ATG16/PF08614_11/1_4e02Cep57_CLD_2/PF14197_6/4_4e03Cep57_CLD_2/PF14197_6/0_004ADIP/PF11559_8/0_0085ADIP/PF11559_8/1_8e04bZIP_1/PF00170_21/2_3e03bZIP_1/PF00170_21/0_017bZIP_1/PF00170_21/1_8e04Herpes_U30/PF04523_13/0_24MbeD_MobD/PF04899_12/64MbeD_MobD/PF04899_12/9_NODE_11
MSIWQCAVGADREASASIDTLCSSEAETWSKLSCAMLSHQTRQLTKNMTAVEVTAQQKLEALVQDNERKSNLIVNLSGQVANLQKNNGELLARVQALTKQLDVLEAQNLTLTKEKVGIAKELVVAQNTVRKLYKEVQMKKAPPPRPVNEPRNANGCLLAPPGLWPGGTNVLRLEKPVLPPPPLGTMNETPDGAKGKDKDQSNQENVEVVVEQQEVTRKKPEKKATQRTTSRKKAAEDKKNIDEKKTDQEKPKAAERPKRSKRAAG